jgi:nitronate monooxygenase
MAQNVTEMEQQGAKLEELAPLISGRGEKEVFETGELEKGLVHCGQSVGLIRDIPTVKELIDRIAAEAEEITRRLAGN